MGPTGGLVEVLGLDGEEATGANIVKVAMEAPLKQLAVKAGLEGGVVAEEVRESPRARASTPLQARSIVGLDGPVKLAGRPPAT